MCGAFYSCFRTWTAPEGLGKDSVAVSVPRTALKLLFHNAILHTTKVSINVLMMFIFTSFAKIFGFGLMSPLFLFPCFSVFAIIFFSWSDDSSDGLA